MGEGERCMTLTLSIDKLMCVCKWCVCACDMCIHIYVNIRYKLT